MANDFFAGAEARSVYPATQSTSDFVKAAYLNLFERAVDAAGDDYWVGQLNAGAVSKGVFLIGLADGALSGPHVLDEASQLPDPLGGRDGLTIPGRSVGFTNSKHQRAALETRSAYLQICNNH